MHSSSLFPWDQPLPCLQCATLALSLSLPVGITFPFNRVVGWAASPAPPPVFIPG